jgi:hypothetical protein
MSSLEKVRPGIIRPFLSQPEKKMAATAAKAPKVCVLGGNPAERPVVDPGNVPVNKEYGYCGIRVTGTAKSCSTEFLLRTPLETVKNARTLTLFIVKVVIRQILAQRIGTDIYSRRRGLTLRREEDNAATRLLDIFAGTQGSSSSRASSLVVIDARD